MGATPAKSTANTNDELVIGGRSSGEHWLDDENDRDKRKEDDDYYTSRFGDKSAEPLKDADIMDLKMVCDIYILIKMSKLTSLL